MGEGEEIEGERREKRGGERGEDGRERERGREEKRVRRETGGEERRGERCREIVERGEEEIVREERGKEGTGEEKKRGRENSTFRPVQPRRCYRRCYLKVLPSVSSDTHPRQMCSEATLP